MKLATLKNGSRDGRLVVVSKDLTRCTDAARIAPTLQAALDDWESVAPRLARIHLQWPVDLYPVAVAQCVRTLHGLAPDTDLQFVKADLGKALLDTADPQCIGHACAVVDRDGFEPLAIRERKDDFNAHRSAPRAG